MDAFADPDTKDPVSPFVQLLWERGTTFESEVVAGLEDPFTDLSQMRGQEKEGAMRAAIAAGDRLIYSGRLSLDDLLGEPDILRREGRATSRSTSNPVPVRKAAMRYRRLRQAEEALWRTNCSIHRHSGSVGYLCRSLRVYLGYSPPGKALRFRHPAGTQVAVPLGDLPRGDGSGCQCVASAGNDSAGGRLGL